MRWPGREQANREAPPSGEHDGGLAGECEAYLAGDYAEHAGATGHLIPVWARLNALAHADEATLSHLALDRVGPHASVAGSEWQRAVAYLAGATLEEAGARGMTVTDLQASLLIPLELLLADDETTWDLSPGQLVAVGLAVLRRHPSSTHRGSDDPTAPCL